jgi:hypothetical protein
MTRLVETLRCLAMVGSSGARADFGRRRRRGPSRGCPVTGPGVRSARHPVDEEQDTEQQERRRRQVPHRALREPGPGHRRQRDRDPARQRSCPSRRRARSAAPPGCRQRQRGEHRLVTELGHEEGQRHPEQHRPATQPGRSSSSSSSSAQGPDPEPRNSRPPPIATARSGRAAPSAAPTSVGGPSITNAAMAMPRRPRPRR